MKNISMWIVISAFGIMSASAAYAEDPAPTTTTTTTDGTTTTTTTDGTTTSTDVTVPDPGVVPPAAVAPPAPGCGPLGYSKVDKDLNPGRGKRVTGGMLVVLGIATLVPGAAMLGWAERHDPKSDQPVDDLRAIRISGGIATALGGLSVLAGIPVLASGVAQGRRERERRITLAPSIAPRNGGGMAALGGTF